MAEASRLTPTGAHDLKKGSMAILKGHPCKIVEVKTSKTGKHGHAKCNITGICQITGKKYQEVKPGHFNMMEVHIDKDDRIFSYIDEDDAICFDDNMEEVRVATTEEQRAKLE